jgi:hypothetical protein
VIARAANRRRAATVGAAALACAAALAAVPATGFGAVAGLQDDQLTSGPLTEIDQRLPLTAATGTKITRFDILWSQVATTPPTVPADPNDAAYDWSRTDRIVCGFAQRKIGLLVSAFSAPAWATTNLKGPPKDSEVNANYPRIAAYRDFMAALAKRYSGNFAPTVKDTTCTAPTLPRIRLFEIWNEPHITRTLAPQYKGKRPTAFLHYVNMTKAAYPAIRSANGAKFGRRAIVIGGVGAPRSTDNRQGMSALVWMQKLLRSSAKFDWYSQHIYSGTPPRRKTEAVPAWSTVPVLLDEIKKVKKRKKVRLIITEAGYTTGRGARSGKKAVVSRSQQANYLKQIFQLKEVRTRIPLVIWFNLSDNPNWPGGLLLQNGKRKPSYGPFVAQAKRTKTLPALLRP